MAHTQPLSADRGRVCALFTSRTTILERVIILIVCIWFDAHDINAYADKIERKVIIDQRAHRSKATLPMEKADAARYKARSTVERTNSELKDGFLPDKIYRRGSHARYDIELAILLTTMKKAWRMLLVKEEARAEQAS